MGMLEKMVIVIVLLVVAFLGGMAVEGEKFSAYKYEQKGIAESQAKFAKDTDAKNKGDANDAQQSYVEAINGVDAWYRDHPVTRLQYIPHTGTVSKADCDTKSTDETAPGQYVSPYSPADTEQIAVRLDQLQKLLIRDGVNLE
jgi:hypothetical protein